MQCKMGDDAFDDGPLGDFGDESHGGGDGGSIATRAAERGPHVEVARLKAENKEKQALIERLRNDLITADKQKESYSKEFATVEAQMAFYKQEVDRLTTEEEKFENKAKNFKSQRNDLDDRLDELERQNKKLLRFKESADDDLNQTTEEAKKWKERYNDIAAKHETQETERTDLERNLKSAEAKASDLETKFADISAKYEDAEAQRQKGKIALDRVQAELSTWNKEESEELIASLKKEKFQRDLELEELRLENAKLKKQIEINSGASEDTSNQVDVAGKLQELVYVTKQKDILTSKINEYEEEKTSLQEQVNTLKKAKLEFTNNFDDLEIEHNRMKKKQGVLEQDKNDLEELVKEKETLILEMKAKAKQVAEEVMDNELKLGKFEREQKKMNERLESMEEENAQLKAEAKEKETKIFDNELQAQKMTRELERAKEEVSELRQQHVDVTKEMEAVQMKLKTVTGKQKAWQTRYEEVTEKYEAAEKARSKARVEIEELEEKLSSWNKAEVEAEMAKTKKELLNMSMEFEDLKVENSKLQREKERATGELGDINKAAALAKEENKSAEIEALTKQKQILKAKVDEHEAAMAALNATMEELKKSKLELTSDLDELQFQHERLKKMKLTVDADYATLEEQMQGKVTEIGELKLKTKTMEDESFEAELQLDKEKRKFASMEEKMQLLESVAEELKTLKVESKEKEEKVFEAKLNEGKLTREIETLKGENESIRGKLLDLTKANEESQTKIMELEAEQKKKTDDYEEMELKFEKTENLLTRTRSGMDQLKQEMEKKETVEVENVKLKKEKFDLDMAIEKLKTQNAALLQEQSLTAFNPDETPLPFIEDMEALADMPAPPHQTNPALVGAVRNGKIPNMVAASKLIVEKKEELKLAQKRNNILSAKMAEYEDEISTLSGQVSNLKKVKLQTIAELDDVRIEHSRLKKQKLNYEEDLANAEERLKRRDTGMEDLRKEKEEEIQDLRTRAKSNANDKYDAELKLDRNEREMKMMQEKFEGMESEIKLLKEQAKEKEQTFFDADMKLGNVNREAQKLREELDDLRTRNDSMSKQVEESAAKIMELEALNSERGQSLQSASLKSEEAENKVSILEKEVDHLHGELEKKAEVDNELVSLQKEKLELDLKVQHMSSEIDVLKQLQGEMDDAASNLINFAMQKLANQQTQLLQARLDENEQTIQTLTSTVKTLKQESFDATQDADQFRFENERMERMKRNLEEELETAEESLRVRELEIEELRMAKEDEVEDLQMRLKSKSDASYTKETELEKLKMEVAKLTAELTSMKSQESEREEIEVARTIEKGKRMREVDRLLDEISILEKQNLEYKLKQREEEMMKESTDNILKLQLHKAHAEVAELREELEHVKQEDNKIHTENDELKMVAEQSKAMRMELEELHKQKDMFQHMEKGELIEENMHLKRQIAVGKDELNKLQAEIIVLKSSDTQALRKSFLLVSPSNDAEDHFIKQDSHFDIQTEKALLGEMKTELNRLRKLSDIGAIQPQLNDDPSSPMPGVDDPEDDELPQFDNNLQNGLGLTEMTGSTIEPVWDMSGTFTGNPDEPLEANFFASPRRNRSKATSGREQIQTQG